MSNALGNAGFVASIVLPHHRATVITPLSKHRSIKMTLATASPPSTLRAIFFDLDGTCVNSDHIHFETYRDTLLELVPTFNNGQSITRFKYDTEMSGRQNPELVASILPDMPEAERTKIWQTKERRYEDVIMRGVPPIPGLISLLKACQRHELTHWVVTNAPKGSCKKTMTSIGIMPFFQERITVAEECAHAKPAPDPYLQAVRLAKADAAQAIVFEDSPSGTTAAVAAGLYTIGIRSTQDEEALVNAGAAFTIADYTDPVLIKFLEGYDISIQ